MRVDIAIVPSPNSGHCLSSTSARRRTRTLVTAVGSLSALLQGPSLDNQESVSCTSVPSSDVSSDASNVASRADEGDLVRVFGGSDTLKECVGTLLATPSTLTLSPAAYRRRAEIQVPSSAIETFPRLPYSAFDEEWSELMRRRRADSPKKTGNTPRWTIAGSEKNSLRTSGVGVTAAATSASNGHMSPSKETGPSKNQEIPSSVFLGEEMTEARRIIRLPRALWDAAEDDLRRRVPYRTEEFFHAESREILIELGMNKELTLNKVILSMAQLAILRRWQRVSGYDLTPAKDAIGAFYRACTRRIFELQDTAKIFGKTFWAPHLASTPKILEYTSDGARLGTQLLEYWGRRNGSAIAKLLEKDAVFMMTSRELREIIEKFIARVRTECTAAICIITGVFSAPKFSSCVANLLALHTLLTTVKRDCHGIFGEAFDTLHKLTDKCGELLKLGLEASGAPIEEWTVVSYDFNAANFDAYSGEGCRFIIAAGEKEIMVGTSQDFLVSGEAFARGSVAVRGPDDIVKTNP